MKEIAAFKQRRDWLIDPLVVAVALEVVIRPPAFHLRHASLTPSTGLPDLRRQRAYRDLQQLDVILPVILTFAVG